MNTGFKWTAKDFEIERACQKWSEEKKNRGKAWWEGEKAHEEGKREGTGGERSKETKLYTRRGPCRGGWPYASEDRGPPSFQLCEGFLWRLSSRWEEAARRRLISSNCNRPVITAPHCSREENKWRGLSKLPSVVYVKSLRLEGRTVKDIWFE